MRHARRSDLSPRVEMTPLIDVIFLLLTFFIYSMVVSRPVDTMDFQLAPVAGGQAATGGAINILSIDGQGALFFNSEPVTDGALNNLLEGVAADPAEPTLYLTLAQDGQTDRGPQLFDLFQRVQQAGVTRFAVVGSPPPEVTPARPALK